MNIGRILSYAPPLLAPYYGSYTALLDELELDPKLRQLTILRVATRADAPYIIAQHATLAKSVGVNDNQIVAVRQPVIESRWFTPVQQLVLAFVDEATQMPRISDSLFEAVRPVLPPREIVELVLVIGWYWTACRLTTTLDLEPERALGSQLDAILRNQHSRRPGNLAPDHPNDTSPTDRKHMATTRRSAWGSR
jgi:alkylhydroperoxidase family enzyme